MKKLISFFAFSFLLFVMVWAQTKPSLKASMQRGKKVYEQNCLPCHQQDGGGVPRMNPPLVKTDFVLGDKKRLITIVLSGMKEQTEINGRFYENVMAAHDSLTNQQIGDVLTYVRNSFGNKASAVSAAEVKKVRASLK